MATYFRCKRCGEYGSVQCECGSANVEVMGDIYLGIAGVDGYISVKTDRPMPCIIVKKPSGQVTIDLDAQDLILGWLRKG